MEHNFVFFWGAEDYYRVAFSEIVDEKNVKYIAGVVEQKKALIRYLHKLHHSSVINKRVNLPFRKLWNRTYFKNTFANKNNLIFIFHGGYYWMRSVDYFAYLRQSYPGCKCVMLLMDTVDSYVRYFKGKSYGDFSIEYIKNNFDLVLTYNKIDAERYGLVYYPSVYSKLERIKRDKTIDVFFVGRDKKRLEYLHDLYRKFTNEGLVCKFFITNVPKSKQLNEDGIIYNKYLSYHEILNYLDISNGILEIVQEGSLGFTFRLDEALCYDCNLITNNAIINYIEYGKSKKIFDLNSIDSLEKESFIKTVKESYDYKADYSPRKLLEYLEQSL